jgi:hypothetical protein
MHGKQLCKLEQELGRSCIATTIQLKKQAKLDTQFIKVWSQGQLFCKFHAALK